MTRRAINISRLASHPNDFDVTSKAELYKGLDGLGFVPVYCQETNEYGHYEKYYWYSKEFHTFARTNARQDRNENSTLEFTYQYNLEETDIQIAGVGSTRPAILPDGDTTMTQSIWVQANPAAFLEKMRHIIAYPWRAPYHITFIDSVDEEIQRITGEQIHTDYELGDSPPVILTQWANPRSSKHTKPEPPPIQRMLAAGKNPRQLKNGLFRTKELRTRYWWIPKPPFDYLLYSAQSIGTALRLQQETDTILQTIAQFKPYHFERRNTEYLTSKKLCFNADWGNQPYSRSLQASLEDGKTVVRDYCSKAILWVAP